MTVDPIAAVGLTKRFGSELAVNDATFAVPVGAVTGFIGANGSGKTTTLRTLLGLTKPTAGSATIFGTPYRQLPHPRLVVGSVLDRLGGHPGLSGRQHLGFVATGADLDRSRIDHVLELVGLAPAADRKLGSYSTGMAQRLALAAALLADPPLLVLDEPARGLDPAGIRWLRQLLRDRADEGAAVFISTHQLAELAEVVDHVVVIDRGRIVADEPTDRLRHRTGQARLEDAVLDLTDPTEPT